VSRRGGLPAALVDIDGTLVDSNYQHALAWFRALRGNGVVRPLWEIHRHIGMGGDHMVAALAGDDVERDAGDAIRDAASRH
jgi:beta-phosphoglucomutase-like phosphatase (HAD superfamily)